MYAKSEETSRNSNRNVGDQFFNPRLRHCGTACENVTAMPILA